MFDRHAGVLHPGIGLGIALHAHQQPQTGFAQLPNGLLGSGLDRPHIGIAHFALAQPSLQLVHLAAQLGFRLGEVFDDQQSGGVAVEKAAARRVLNGIDGLVEQNLVDQFAGDRRGLQSHEIGLHRLDQVGEMHGDQPLVRRQFDQIELGFDHRAQSAFGTDRDLAQIKGRAVNKFIEIVAGNAPHHRRKPRADLFGAIASNAANFTVDLTFEIVAGGALLVSLFIHRPQYRPRTVGEDHFQFEDVVDGLAVNDRMSTAGVVADHTADIGTAAGGNIGRKNEPVRLEIGVEFVENQARLHAHPTLGGIELEHAVHVFGTIEVNSRPHRLSRQAGTAAARQHGGPICGRDGDGGSHVVFVPGHDQAQWFDRVDTGIGAVEHAGHGVEAHFAFDSALQGRC